MVYIVFLAKRKCPFSLSEIDSEICFRTKTSIQKIPVPELEFFEAVFKDSLICDYES
jgi:hypothetical protein